jgi:hypothetical protein
MTAIFSNYDSPFNISFKDVQYLTKAFVGFYSHVITGNATHYTFKSELGILSKFRKLTEREKQDYYEEVDESSITKEFTVLYDEKLNKTHGFSDRMLYIELRKLRAKKTKKYIDFYIKGDKIIGVRQEKTKEQYQFSWIDMSVDNVDLILRSYNLYFFNTKDFSSDNLTIFLNKDGYWLKLTGGNPYTLVQMYEPLEHIK